MSSCPLCLTSCGSVWQSPSWDRLTFLILLFVYYFLIKEKNGFKIQKHKFKGELYEMYKVI